MRKRDLTWRWGAPLVGALMVEACSAGGPAPAERPAPQATPAPASSRPAPGVYGPNDACVQVVLKEREDRVGWVFCVDSVTVAEDGGLRFRTSWTRFGMPPGEIQKTPDAGNRNIFIVDDRGRRHDHYDTTEAANLGGSLRQDGDRLEGEFLFRAPSPGSSRFDFHDEDQGVRIRGIVLDASRQMASAAERRLVAQKVLAAKEVEIIESWNGLGSSLHGEWNLRGGAAGFSGDATVPSKAAQRFLQILAEAPLFRGHYQAEGTDTDDYPGLSILVGVGADVVGFWSESQGQEHVPWGARTFTEVFVVPSNHPARALESLRPYLGPTPKGEAEAGSIQFSPRQGELLNAVLSRDLARAQASLDAGAAPLGNHFRGMSPLHLAANRGDLPMVRLLLRRGALLDGLDAQRATPLLAAARGGRVEVVEALLTAGARPDLATRHGFTSLHAAAGAGSPDLVKRLLQAGIPPDVRTRDGSTPLMYARGAAVTKVLLAAGADPNATGLLVTPLIAAAGASLPDPETGGNFGGDRDAPAQLHVLLEAGAQVDAPDPVGRTALMVAASGAADHEASLELVRLLLAAGADPNRRSTRGDSVLSSATASYLGDRLRRHEARTLEMVQLLLDAGASDQPDSQGQTLLSRARAAGAPKLVELLLPRR